MAKANGMRLVDRCGWVAVGMALGPALLGAQATPAGGRGGVPLRGLDRVQYGVGYVANPPEMLAGVGAYVLFPVLGGIGVYVDGKWDVDTPEEDLAFRPGVTPAELEAATPGVQYLKREASWRSLNAGIVRPFSPWIMGYAGVGLASASYYRLYEELEMEVGRAILVRSAQDDETRINLMVGVLLRLTSAVTTHLGLEGQPRGVTVGASLRLPPW